ncbi:hypothetical protein JVU11DRAFT_10661 [Chiua virens]|nr:hypothetical protein JVU11DRAFT_10661 [Chiua virens]
MGFFITPELLHYLHKEFWDHDLQWCLNIIGEAEFNFQFSVLQPTAGSRHFKGSISKLKPVTGRVHRDVQRYLIAVIAGAAPPEVIIAIHALMDFRYRVQAYCISDADIQLISTALDVFHAHKHAVLENGGQRGKGNRVIDNWYIPKLELMQSIAPSIKCVGVTIQWTADTMEHAHVSEIKMPARSTNNNNYDPQICCYLDWAEKCRSFELATSLHEQDAIRNQNTLLDGLWSSGSHTSIHQLLYHFSPTLWKADRVHSVAPPQFHCSIDEAAQKFGLPDLQAALADFLWREEQYGEGFMHPIGGQRCGSVYSNLPFMELQLWCKPWRRFVLGVSIASFDLQVHLYDHSGSAVSPPFNIHTNAQQFLFIITALTFGCRSSIGFDLTIKIHPPSFSRGHSDSIHASASNPKGSKDPQESVEEWVGLPHRTSLDPIELKPSSLITSPALPTVVEPSSPPPLADPPLPLVESPSTPPPPGEIPLPPVAETPIPAIGKIRVDDVWYEIIDILFSSTGFMGRGTVCYLA